MNDITLVTGLPGTGKTTWVSEHLGNGIAFDLDYIQAAIRYGKPHEVQDVHVRTVANKLLGAFVIAGLIEQESGKDFPIFVIRTAPKLEELELIKPTKIIYCTTCHTISHRADAHELTSDEIVKIAMRTKGTIDWARANGVEFTEIGG